ncbi:MAG: hypothetical protein OIF58_02590 [Cohaesibacter sp.]|nr:hypothetical protein [Cohaesibacter sp.]
MQAKQRKARSLDQEAGFLVFIKNELLLSDQSLFSKAISDDVSQRLPPQDMPE